MHDEKPPSAPPTLVPNALETTDFDALSTTFPEPEEAEGEPALEPIGPAREPRPRYEILGPLGAGAMGTVYTARDHDLRRVVALKELSPAANRPHPRRRFLAEVQITAQLDHPNIVPVYALEAGPHGLPGYTMKLVRGQSLADVIAEARAAREAHRAPPEACALPARLEVLLRVCDAMAYAHAKRVVHRDLKPANILIGLHHEVYVMDWGVARLLGEREASATTQIGLDPQAGAHATRVGSVVGTPATMSPEQASGMTEAVGPLSDVFALGLILYELVFLRPAYAGGDAADVLARARAGKLGRTDLPIEDPAAAADLVAVIRRATAYQPGERYPSASALGDDLRRVLRREETVARPDDLWRGLRRRVIRDPRIAFLALALLMSIGGLGAVGVWARGEVNLAAERAAALELQQRVGGLVGRVGDQARRIDQHFMWFEAELEGLAGAAVHTLLHADPVDAPAWSALQYRTPGQEPPDLVDSPHFRRPVSPRWPVYKAAPGVDEAVWRADLGRLEGLRGRLRQMYLAGPDGRVADEVDDLSRVFSKGTPPLEWAYVAVDRSGLMYLYPGAAGWDEHYDPRVRPWYVQAVEAGGRTWTRPYVDLMGQGRLISCVRPLYAPDGTFLGVAGLDLEFRALSQRYTRFDIPGFVASYLVDRDARVVVSTEAEDDPFVVPDARELDDGLYLGRVTEPAVLSGLSTQRSGWARTAAGERLLLWAPLPKVGWTFVVVLDAEAALAEAAR